MFPQSDQAQGTLMCHEELAPAFELIGEPAANGPQHKADPGGISAVSSAVA